MKRFLLPSFLMSISTLFAASISETSNYPKFCYEAANDDTIFMNFKRAQEYRWVLEHVSYEQGLAYLDIIRKNHPEFLASLSLCKDNDLVGNPLKSDFGSDVGYISPSTLRYMKVAGDLKSIFGDLQNKRILEIGGGYGGQCKILSVLTGFSEYTIIDLPEAGMLTDKYLKVLGIKNFKIYSSKSFNPDNEYDLVISNYALSEISADEQIQYIDKIINRSSAGYMTYNFTSNDFGITSLSQDELLRLIKMPNRTIKIIEEKPLTSSENIIIIWY